MIWDVTVFKKVVDDHATVVVEEAYLDGVVACAVFLLLNSEALLRLADKHLHAFCNVDHNEDHGEPESKDEGIGKSAAVSHVAKGKSREQRVKPGDIVRV